MTNDIFFISGIALLLTHEMDAVHCKEWRIIPGLSMLDEKIGRNIFLLAHIPIFYLLVWQLIYTPNNEILRIVFDIFLVFHLGLHLIFLKHNKNEFLDWFSWTVITGCTACGLIDLLLI